MIYNERMGRFVGSLPDRDTALAIVADDEQFADLAEAGWTVARDGAVLLRAMSGRESTGPKNYAMPIAHEIWINSVLVGWRKSDDVSEPDFWTALIGQCYALASVLLSAAADTPGIPGMTAVVVAGPEVEDLATVYFHSSRYELPRDEADGKMIMVLDSRETAGQGSRGARS